MFAGIDPRVMRVVGAIVGCAKREPPGPEMIAKIAEWPVGHDLEPTGLPDLDTLHRMQNDPDILELHRAELLSKMKAPQARTMSKNGGGNATDTGETYKPRMISARFVGESVRAGVHPLMAEHLAAAEARLAGELAALLADVTEGPVLRERGITSTSAADLKAWLGIKQQHTGWREGKEQGYHRYGCAIDVNRDKNAWVAVRSGNKVGGEGTATSIGTAQFDLQGLEVIDRAGLFMIKRRAELQPENTGMRDRAGDTGAAVKRFATASKAVADYFALVFAPNDELLQWGPKAGEQDCPLPTNLTLLPGETAIANVERVIRDVHGGGWPLAARAMVAKIKADLFPLARDSAKGTITKNPRETKNPTKGFMDLDARLASALTETGRLHWGGCEFGGDQSGDLMHFDAGRVPALGSG